MVRTDAYSYLNITGIPFCNSARECEKLCSKTNLWVGEHSAMKHYRFAAHVFLVTLGFILGYLILRVRVVNIGFWHLLILLVVVEAIVTWFINIHADAAEALQTCFLVENFTSKGFDYMQNVIPVCTFLYSLELQERPPVLLPQTAPRRTVLKVINSNASILFIVAIITHP